MRPHDRRTFLTTTAGGMAALALGPMVEPLLASPLRAPRSIGVIGMGRQGRAIVAELQKIGNVTIAAVCDTEEGRLSTAVRRAAGAQPYADHRALLDKANVDAVIIATPTHQHKDIALAAIQAGKHVYCESPLAHTIEDAKAIAKAAQGLKTTFMVGMQGRSNPIYKLAWTFVRSGSIRDFVRMRGQYHRKTTWRNPAPDAAREKAANWQLDPAVSIGLAGEFGTQQFDVFNWYFNRYPKSVRGAGAIRIHQDGREVFDTIRCTLDYGDGVFLDYDATLGNSYEGTHELMYGSMGTVKLTWTHGWLFKEADAPTQGWEVYANRQTFHNEEGITLIADATQLASQGRLKEGVGLPHDSLHYALADFLKCIEEGRTPPTTADEGMRAAAVGILANQAIVTGGEVAIDEARLTT